MIRRRKDTVGWLLETNSFSFFLMQFTFTITVGVAMLYAWIEFIKFCNWIGQFTWP